MALYCHYLTLLSILVFIFECSSLKHGEIDGMKYILVDQASANKKQFFESLFDSEGRMTQDKLTPLSRSRRAAPSQHSLIYPSNSTRHGQATEYELHGDNHTVAFLHWSGSKSQVIFIFTSNYRNIHLSPGGSVFMDSAYLWRSTDYGTSFKRDDNKFSKSKTINGIHFCTGNNQRVIVYDKQGKWVYVSEDEGNTYIAHQITFAPYEIQCMGSTKQNLMTAFDEETKKLYYSSDGGKTWAFLCAQIVKYSWAPGITGVNSTKLFIETREKSHYSSVLKIAKLPCDASEVKLFDPKLGNFEAHSFEVEGKYMFVKKMYPMTALYVSYNCSSFKKAQFPLKLTESDYNVIDASEDEVLVSVRHEGIHTYYNLYVSDISGTKYSLSLRRILASATYHWGQKLKLADIHMVKSLRGVFLANTLEPNSIVRTFITFDKGGLWHPLRVPKEFQSKCYLPRCSLNLHMVHSQRYYQIPSVLSSESAVGLIMAQGDVGSSLTGSPDVFISADGGLTWNKVLEGSYDFVFGDHGGLIVAVPLHNYTKTVSYSCTEGKTWDTLLMEKDVRAYGLVTEPGETTWVSNIFGQHSSKDFEWLSVKLNLSSVFERKCRSSDYELWTPNDERMRGKCLLGEKMTYERRKADVCCYNGQNYDRAINQTSCNCSLEDFMCDFGFMESDIVETCVAISQEYIVPENCPEFTPYLRTSGYRKVPGDRCVAGIENQFKPNETMCPVKAPSGLAILLDKTVIAAHRDTVFKLQQEKGSTRSTWYMWDFGDVTAPAIITGLQKAKKSNHTFTRHGYFNVTVSANNSVGRESTKIVVQVIDEIIRVRITPPHAVLVDHDVRFNLTLFSQHPLSWNAEHGFVHFVWVFDADHRKLTWDNEVEHKFAKAGKYKITVEAINDVSRQFGSIVINVHDDLRTLRLTFDNVLENKNEDTIEWRDEFAKMLWSALIRALDISKDRLEVAVVPGRPTLADVSIIPRDQNTSKSMDEISKMIISKVNDKSLSVTFPDGERTQVVYAEVLDNNPGKKHIEVPGNNSKDSRLAIAIGMAAAVVVLFLAGIIFYAYRRYTWLYRRYHRLSMNGRDGFTPLQTDEGVGVNLDDDTVRYHAVPEPYNMDDSEDEMLINDMGESGCMLVINDEAQQDNSQSSDAARA